MRSWSDERVFIDPDAAEFLDDKLLDADVVGEDVQFSLDVQAESSIRRDAVRIASVRFLREPTEEEHWT